MQSSCVHEKTGFLVRRDGVDYVRCVDCGQILEADDLEQVRVPAAAADDQES